jgi:hypothetical protein
MTSHFMKPEKDALDRVIENWGLFEFVMCLIFFPYSLFYILFRVIQESSKD